MHLHLYRRRNERLTDWEIERELVAAVYGLWWNNGNLKNNFFIISRNSNAPHYINVLNNTMIPFIQNDGPEFSSMTMQGFTRRESNTFLAQFSVNVLRRSALSPDMNPIEHAWDELGQTARSNYQINAINNIKDALLLE